MSTQMNARQRSLKVHQIDEDVLADIASMIDERWNQLARCLPRHNEDGPCFHEQDIKCIEAESTLRNVYAAAILLDEWSMENLSMRSLHQTVEALQMYDVAKFIRRAVFDEIDDYSCDNSENMDSICSVEELSMRIEEESGCKGHEFTYNELATLTNNFDDIDLIDGGNLIGIGGFGEVFIGEMTDRKIAVKRLRLIEDCSDITEQFIKELEVLSRFRHDNILPVIGYCCEVSRLCIVTSYMMNGSLCDRLATTPALTFVQRITIAIGTVNAIDYLHTHEEVAVIHRDIKSANILLDEKCEAKLCDCALARLGPSPKNEAKSFTKTNKIVGTTVYLPPEYERYGIISTSMDIYSFGVVLLELLTSLQSFDPAREDCGLADYITEELRTKTILDLVDRRVQDWNNVEDVYQVASECLGRRKSRPTSNQLLDKLKHILELHAVMMEHLV